MEPLWSPVVATGGKRWQVRWAETGREQAETVAVGCDQLPSGPHGKQGVCRGLPPVAGGPLPAKEEVDLLAPQTPSPANPKAQRTWTRSLSSSLLVLKPP